MKSRIKPGHSQQTIIKKNHTVFNRLRSIVTFKKQLPAPVPCSVPATMLEQSLHQKRLIELEAERNQAAGLAYVNMLPPR